MIKDIMSLIYFKMNLQFGISIEIKNMINISIIYYYSLICTFNIVMNF